MNYYKEQIDLIDAKIQELKNVASEINEQIRKSNTEKSNINDDCFARYGILTKSECFLSPARTIVEIAPSGINWEVSPPELSYRVYGQTQQDETETLNHTELKKKMDEGFYVPINIDLPKKAQPVKPLAKSILLQEVRKHNDNVYIGITKKNQMIVFETYPHHVDKYRVNEAGAPNKFKLRYSSKDRGYSVHPEVKSSYSYRRRKTFHRTTILKVCNSKEDLVEYLI